jgi:hypothetical protein
MVGNKDGTLLSEELEALLQGVLQLSAQITGLGDAYVRSCCSVRCNLLSRARSMEPARVTGHYSLQWKLWPQKSGLLCFGRQDASIKCISKTAIPSREDQSRHRANDGRPTLM